MFQDSIKLNWLPPTQPNGEVHYVIYYTPEGGTEQSIDTGSDQTKYIMTQVERNRVLSNIAVQALNLAGKSDRSAVIAQYHHTPLATSTLSEQISEIVSAHQHTDTHTRTHTRTHTHMQKHTTARQGQRGTTHKTKNAAHYYNTHLYPYSASYLCYWHTGQI